eukprot:Mycagemm_TRINITY_DN9012_c0_g1::TRINITY_DN9012_c0_g1_i1::g.5352::m.5352 type:complete len:103 gc:universal TRINITY_DN9012_c0_g1_i1:3-311(+)
MSTAPFCVLLLFPMACSSELSSARNFCTAPSAAVKVLTMSSASAVACAPPVCAVMRFRNIVAWVCSTRSSSCTDSFWCTNLSSSGTVVSLLQKARMRPNTTR